MHILVVDAKRLYADSLAAYLMQNVADVEGAEAITLDEAARERQAGKQPDLILLDVELAGLTGPKSLGRLRERYPESRVVVMDGSASEQRVRDALDQHAAGFVLKSISGPAMIKVLELVLSGESYIPASFLEEANPKARRGSVATPQAGNADAFETLTPRERQALQLVLKGLSNKEIARELGIREVTAAFHLRGLFRKLAVSNRTQAATLALENGWKAS